MSVAMSFFRKAYFLWFGYRNWTKRGYENMKVTEDDNIDNVDLSGKSVMVTGATSGLGLHCAKWLATRGATVHLVVRNKERGEHARDNIIQESNNKQVHLHLCDMSIMSEVRSFATEFVKAGHPLDVLVNNAGVLLTEKELSSEGIDKTLATNTLSGFLLTNLLITPLRRSKDARVIAISSGGMITEKLLVGEAFEKEAKKEGFDGRTVYALTKRHQVALTERWASRLTKATGIGFYSMHPGWTDTEGLQSSMPDFHKFMKDKLRSLPQGTDTIRWLIASTHLNKSTQSGEFFRDREPEMKHISLGGTKYDEAKVDQLWSWCSQLSGWKDEEFGDIK
jgi:dehydrogenase/reductase SDR family protein 12